MGSVQYPSYYDMYVVMKRYLTDEEYLHWRKAFDAAVAYVAASPTWYSAVCGRVIRYDKESAGGVSWYLPQGRAMNETFNRDFKTTEWYSAAGWEAAGW